MPLPPRPADETVVRTVVLPADAPTATTPVNSGLEYDDDHEDDHDDDDHDEYEDEDEHEYEHEEDD
jgi:hypothetical protein